MMTTKPTKVAELYGINTSVVGTDWQKITTAQNCPYLNRKCLKNRKSEASLTVGTCTMSYGKNPQPVMICPARLLERSQVFQDCVHLLKLHEPGNELRIIGEVSVPGGSVDYCLVSVRDGKVKDFVGIELQTLDTTGTVWPERQRFLKDNGISVKPSDANSKKPFGMNWKMSSKTILVQLHHKLSTFEHLCKRLVLVTQDCLLSYMRSEFNFQNIKGVRDGDPMHFHSYKLKNEPSSYKIDLVERVSTDMAGLAASLGLQADSKVDLVVVLDQLNSKLPKSTLLAPGGTIPAPEIVVDSDEE